MLEKTTEGVRLHVYVQPNGRKSEVLGEYDGQLKIRVQAPPVEGQANAAVEEFVASLFDLSPRKAQLLRGQTSRQKVIHLTGIDFDQAQLILHSILNKNENQRT